jgi:hypothetical protein
LSDIENVIAGRFPTSESLGVAEDLLEFIQIIGTEDRDRQLIRLGLHLDEISGLRDAVKALNEAAAIINRDLRPRPRREDLPAASVALRPEGEVALYLTRRLSPTEGVLVKGSIMSVLDAWTDSEG